MVTMINAAGSGKIYEDFSPVRKAYFSNAYLCPMIREVYSDAARPWEKEESDVATDLASSFSLIVWNDEVNTFEWVIETLVQVCGHTQEQAEQCAMLIHTQGKYAVKKASYETLKPMCDAITDRGIGATIEESAG